MTFLETQRTPRWIACNKSLKLKWSKCWLLSLSYLFCHGCPCMYYFVAWNLVSLWPKSWINLLPIIIYLCNVLFCLNSKKVDHWVQSKKSFSRLQHQLHNGWAHQILASIQYCMLFSTINIVVVLLLLFDPESVAVDWGENFTSINWKFY